MKHETLRPQPDLIAQPSAMPESIDADLPNSPRHRISRRGILFAGAGAVAAAIAAAAGITQERSNDTSAVSTPTLTPDQDLATRYPGVSTPNPRVSPYNARYDGGYVNANGGQDVFPSPSPSSSTTETPVPGK